MKAQSRIEIIDALRGLALLGIIIIHCIEHFEIFKPSNPNSPLVLGVDGQVFESVIFMIGGKAYSIFAILFGYSFFIQMDNKAQQGKDFRFTFLWRLVVLFVIGFLHSIFYRGDILHIYALVGIPFILCYSLSNRALLIIAGLLIVQVPLLYLALQAFTDPDFVYAPYYGDGYFPEGEEIYTTGSMWEVFQFNLYKARVVVWAWTYHTGRLVQLFGLFIIGLVIARKGYLLDLRSNRYRVAFIGYFCLILMLLMKLYISGIESFDWTDDQKTLMTMASETYLNLFYTLTVCCGFILLYIYGNQRVKVFEYMAAYGRMSLTNYMTQAVLGVFLFYQFGMGLWDDLGATWSLVLGLVLFIAQTMFSVHWLRSHRYGPMEWLWRALTYWDFDLPNKKDKLQITEALV